MKELKKYQAGGDTQPMCPEPTTQLELDAQNKEQAVNNPDIAYSAVEGVPERGCSNCALFDISPRMQSCVASEPHIGYCWANHFKCDSQGICSTWEENGPIKTDIVSFDKQSEFEEQQAQQQAQEQQMQAQQQGPPQQGPPQQGPPQQGPPPEMMQQMPPQQMGPPQAQMMRYGGELPKAQYGYTGSYNQGSPYQHYGQGAFNPYMPSLPYGLSPGMGQLANQYQAANVYGNLFDSVKKLGMGAAQRKFNRNNRLPKSAYQKHTITNAPEGYKYNPNVPDIDSPGTFDTWKKGYMKSIDRTDKRLKKAGLPGFEESVQSALDMVSAPSGDLQNKATVGFFKNDLIKKRQGKRTSFGQNRAGSGGYGMDTPEGTTWGMNAVTGEEKSYAPGMNPYEAGYEDPDRTQGWSQPTLGIPKGTFQPGGSIPKAQNGWTGRANRIAPEGQMRYVGEDTYEPQYSLPPFEVEHIKENNPYMRMGSPMTFNSNDYQGGMGSMVTDAFTLPLRTIGAYPAHLTSQLKASYEGQPTDYRPQAYRPLIQSEQGKLQVPDNKRYSEYMDDDAGFWSKFAMDAITDPWSYAMAGLTYQGGKTLLQNLPNLLKNLPITGEANMLMNLPSTIARSAKGASNYLKGMVNRADSKLYPNSYWENIKSKDQRDALLELSKTPGAEGRRYKAHLDEFDSRYPEFTPEPTFSTTGRTKAPQSSKDFLGHDDPALLKPNLTHNQGRTQGLTETNAELNYVLDSSPETVLKKISGDLGGTDKGRKAKEIFRPLHSEMYEQNFMTDIHADLIYKDAQKFADDIQSRAKNAGSAEGDDVMAFFKRQPEAGIEGDDVFHIWESNFQFPVDKLDDIELVGKWHEIDKRIKYYKDARFARNQTNQIRDKVDLHPDQQTKSLVEDVMTKLTDKRGPGSDRYYENVFEEMKDLSTTKDQLQDLVSGEHIQRKNQKNLYNILGDENLILNPGKNLDQVHQETLNKLGSGDGRIDPKYLIGKNKHGGELERYQNAGSVDPYYARQDNTRIPSRIPYAGEGEDIYEGNRKGQWIDDAIVGSMFAPLLGTVGAGAIASVPRLASRAYDAYKTYKRPTRNQTGSNVHSYTKGNKKGDKFWDSDYGAMRWDGKKWADDVTPRGRLEYGHPADRKEILNRDLNTLDKWMPMWKNKPKQYGGEQLPKAQMGLGGRQYEWWDDPNNDPDNPFGFPDEEEDDNMMTHDSSWGDTFGQKVKNKFNYGMDQIGRKTEWTEGANDLMNVVNQGMDMVNFEQQQLEQSQESWGHKQFAAVQGNRGDYDVNSGIFRPDQKVTAFEDVPSFNAGFSTYGQAQQGREIPPQQQAQQQPPQQQIPQQQPSPPPEQQGNPMWAETVDKYQKSMDFDLSEQEREQARIDYIKHKRALELEKQGSLIQQVEAYVQQLMNYPPEQLQRQQAQAQQSSYRDGGEVEISEVLLKELIAAGADIEIL